MGLNKSWVLGFPSCPPSIPTRNTENKAALAPTFFLSHPPPKTFLIWTMASMLNLFLQAEELNTGRDPSPPPRFPVPPPRPPPTSPFFASPPPAAPAVSREEELTSNPVVAAQQQGLGYPQAAHDKICSASPVS